MTSHDLAVPDESRGRQAFGEGISHHFVSAQRHECEEAIQYEFTHIVLTNVNMTKKSFGAPDFRSSQHKRGCLCIEDLL